MKLIVTVFAYVFKWYSRPFGATVLTEAEVKRPYFHVNELEVPQLTNWRKYLDFEEEEGDYTRTVFLYERCLVTCAFYDEFWFRYARWISAQDGKQEEVRNILGVREPIFICSPYFATERTLQQYAYFEEMSDRVDVARDIHAAILDRMPGHVETIISWSNPALNMLNTMPMAKIHTLHMVVMQHMFSIINNTWQLLRTLNKPSPSSSLDNRQQQQYTQVEMWKIGPAFFNMGRWSKISDFWSGFSG
ncbi:hypothetical protein GLAREA_09031 [Glarea lozoyensis ATCC 20868]|uniref:Pre-mRNA-processing factor 39 n=1 Tax=Glarea lozoyensis (strain ATCC 20868 / MF5171) TaxID=1116229 RepID=S3EFB1_GLAL2|nr:uncharacterized protein GLAREA_09031 [Glarea lozoyensis ATCC 20868]EPE36868.1 hypothetical protein GLAREA_09031 [Glarea lozoyensis ATCC 20868]